MPAPESAPEPRSAAPDRGADWEAFYRDYRKPGYIAGFEITSKLGGGMFGLVFRARKQSIGKDYAIKFLQVDDTEVRRAVLAELEQVKYFAQIDHPNLVSIEDRGEVDGIPYLVMSFAGTETLRDRMTANGALPNAEQRDELVRWFLQCCRGLSALHERSLVHFDIKPANVFLKGNVARLGDYGLSKLVTHSRGSLSMGRGTPYYMAPEMLQRRGDARSDIYSLGVMLYEILCGKVPFTGDSEWEVLRAHETKAPELPPHLSSLEREVLQRCLQKDPAARFQSVHDLIAAFGSPATVGAATWSDVRAGATTSSSPPPPLPTAPPMEDHLAGLGKASRDAARHAKHVAEQALGKAKTVLRETTDAVRKGADELLQNDRRGAFWPWQRQRGNFWPWHRRTAAVVPRRRPVRTALKFLGVTIGLVFAMTALFSMGQPIVRYSTNNFSWPGPVPSGESTTASPVFASFDVPPRFVDLVSTSEPAWVAVRAVDRSAARTMLRQHIDRLRENAPLSAAAGDDAERLPSFQIGPSHRIAVQQASAALESLLRSPRYQPAIAAQLRGMGAHVLVAAADQLTRAKWRTAADVERAQRLHRFLAEATNCRDIEWNDDAADDPSEVGRANRRLGALWTWFTNEFAHSERTWTTFVELMANR